MKATLTDSVNGDAIGRRGACSEAPVDTQPSTDDPIGDRAAEILLAFARLGKGRRQDEGMPRFIAVLLERGDIARRHLGVFALVALAGPMTVSEVAQREGVALSTASLLVTQLAEAGLVERSEDTADRRRTVVTVARRHRRESEQVLAAKLAPLRRAVERMGEGRAEALVGALDILAQEQEEEG